MGQKSISGILFKFPHQLNEKERKLQILLLIPIGLLSNLVITYIFIGILIGANFIPFFMAFSLIIIGIIVILHYWDKLQEKYGMRPIRSSFQLSYQGYVIILLSCTPAFFLVMLMMGQIKGNFWFGLVGL